MKQYYSTVTRFGFPFGQQKCKRRGCIAKRHGTHYALRAQIWRRERGLVLYVYVPAFQRRSYTCFPALSICHRNLPLGRSTPRHFRRQQTNHINSIEATFTMCCEVSPNTYVLVLKGAQVLRAIGCRHAAFTVCQGCCSRLRRYVRVTAT